VSTNRIWIPNQVGNDTIDMMLEIRNFTQNKIDEKFFKKIIKIVLNEVDIKNKVEISL